MKLQRIKVSYEDERGSITDILDSIDFNGATIIKSRKGCIRGNHFHKKTIQYIYVLKGKMKSQSKKIDEDLIEIILETGDLISHESLEAHNFEALEDSTFIVLSSGLRTGKDYEKDTYRLNTPIEKFIAEDIT
jgi:dTDP-4-dehydrorhamnose 3,5-epimerase-like enzyme